MLVKMSSSWKRVIKLVLSDIIVDNAVVTNVFEVGINIVKHNCCYDCCYECWF